MATEEPNSLDPEWEPVNASPTAVGSRTLPIFDKFLDIANYKEFIQYAYLCTWEHESSGDEGGRHGRHEGGKLDAYMDISVAWEGALENVIEHRQSNMAWGIIGSSPSSSLLLTNSMSSLVLDFSNSGWDDLLSDELMSCLTL
jgi:hypothetical protein